MTNGLRVAWVTGAGKGIGRAVAERLVRDGWTVCISARTAKDLENLKAEHRDGAVHTYPLDITDGSAVATCIDNIEDEVGRIELAILNAGTHTSETLAQFTVETTRRLLDVNVMGTVNCLQPLIGRFREHRTGHIAVVGSLAGYRGLPTAAAYGASKAALINLCEALKPELDACGIRLTLINPGFVKTPLTDRNDFEMPFLMPVEKAADAICDKLAGSAFEITLPWRFALVMKMLRVLPDRLFFAITRRMIAR